MKKRSSIPFFNVGISSLLVVFLVILLSSFAALSLSTAKNNFDLSRRLADHRTDYYAACDAAEEALYAFSSGENAFSHPKITQILTDTTNNSDKILTLYVTINGNQTLIIEAAASDDDPVGFEIRKWKKSITRESGAVLNLIK